MKRLMEIVNSKMGFISLETVIVAGLMLTLGVFALQMLFDSGSEAVAMNADKVYEMSELGIGGLHTEDPFIID